MKTSPVGARPSGRYPRESRSSRGYRPLGRAPTGAACLLALVLLSADAFAALGDPQYISFVPEQGALALAENDAAIPLRLDADDHSGVLRAARDLQSDIERVTGVRPELRTSGTPGETALIIGTLGRSALIDDLVARRKLDVRDIEGRRESFVMDVVDAPLPGVDRALVIAGSDKRGTIYGIYDVSEHIGVSPWYWWADVPIVQRDALYMLPGRRVEDGPAVKYRGIFLNDEAPALSGWAVRRLQSRVLRTRVRADPAAARQLPVAGDVGQRVHR